MKKDHILISHGSGGRMSQTLIRELFVKHFDNPVLNKQSDAALIGSMKDMAFTTDSYVVDPIFFPGGDIGKLAVSGTVNDLAVSGAKPKFLSAGFILEEGLPFNHLEQIVVSMAEEASKAEVQIVTGDTKVVKRGQCDKVFINTAGIGELLKNSQHISEGNTILPGDQILITGFLGDHAIAILGARENLSFENPVLSDVAPLNGLTQDVLEKFGPKIKFMRDITRGGLATILNELVDNKSFGIEINENSLPVREEVFGLCELYGFDPLYLANEGKIMMVIDSDFAQDVLNTVQNHSLGSDAQLIGSITLNHTGQAIIKSTIGGSRIIDMLAGEMLPRIC